MVVCRITLPLEEVGLVPVEALSDIVGRLRHGPRCTLSLPLGELLPEALTEYLLTVINGNRTHCEAFRYRECRQQPLTKQGLAQVFVRQMSQLESAGGRCFEWLQLTLNGRLHLRASDTFCQACHAPQTRFLFIDAGGRTHWLAVDDD